MQERLRQLVTARVGVLKAILEGVQMNETQMRAMLTDHTVEDLKLFIPEIGILCIDIVGICLLSCDDSNLFVQQGLCRVAIDGLNTWHKCMHTCLITSCM
jgi:hypothetical protein